MLSRPKRYSRRVVHGAGEVHQGVTVYAKIYRSLWEGSMRGHGLDQLVLVYLCAHSDANGIADVIHDRIAADIGFPIQQVQAAILRLEAPDPRSRSPEARGARLSRLDERRNWGWLIVNYDKYRTANDLEKIKEQNRLRARKHRERLRSSVTDRHVTSRDSNASNAKSRQAVSSKQKQEAEAEEDAEGSVGESSSLFPDSTVIETTKGVKTDTVPASRSRFTPPTLEEVQAYCLERGNGIDPGLWMDHYESNGWRVGPNPMKSWKASVRYWEKNNQRNGKAGVTARGLRAFAEKLRSEGK